MKKEWQHPVGLDSTAHLNMKKNNGKNNDENVRKTQNIKTEPLLIKHVNILRCSYIEFLT